MAFPDFVQFKRKSIQDKEKLCFGGTYTEGITPTGKKSITDTTETDVTNYATAQVSDSNLKATNIKKDVTILGVTGSYEAAAQGDS